MKKKLINENSQKNIHNVYNNKNQKEFNSLLLNIHKYKLYPPPAGDFFEKPKINQSLNFSSLEPIFFKEKKTLIGDGALSKVFLYHHKKSKIKYAIKRMNLTMVLSKTNNKNLILNEINIQSKISHPNIIKLYNYFKDKENKNIFLILEYASKGTLFDYIRYKNGLDESKSFYYFIQAVNAIYFLHKNKIIHRDLKPENLLINHDNILKLCDFGWSVYLNNHKRETFCGTVEYMAPEILKNQGYDFSIDVWSLGILLYELIHSYSPFVVKDLDKNKIENNIVTKELKFQRGISSECKDLISQILMKDVENRIKIEDIYRHPFVLRYINMINRYITFNQFKKENINNNIINSNENKKNVKNNKSNENKNKISKANKFNDDFSEFDTIPSEPEAKKIPGDFDIIIRNFTKIKNPSPKQLISKNKIQTIKTFINKKSLSLNNIKYEDANLNKDKNNKFKKIERNKNFKSFIKESIDEESLFNQPNTLQLTLMKAYSNNKLKPNSKKNNKIKLNISNKKSKIFSKNPLMNSYNGNVKSNINNIFNKEVLSNSSSLNIYNLPKLNRTEIIKKLSNNKSISCTNFKNNFKSFHNSSTNSNMVNHSKGKSKICKKGNIAHKKHLNTLNKKTNFSYNDLNRINQNDNARKKLVLNLSNINVINVYNDNKSSKELYSGSFNVPKIIKKINTFFIRDKSKKDFIIHHEKSKIKNKVEEVRDSKKSASKLCLNLKKTNIKCPFLNKSENQNSKNSQNQIRKNHNALLTNLFSINKSSNKKGNKSSRNMIRNLKLKNNNIPSLNLVHKK